MEQFYDSQIQFALALLLKKHSAISIAGIEIFDRRLTIADKKAMLDMGCKVLDFDLKNTQRRVQKPTFFFIYIEDCDELTSILEANFCPSRLNKICVLSRNFNRGYYHWYCRGLSRHNRHLILNRRRVNLNCYSYERALVKQAMSFQISKHVDARNFLGKTIMMKFYVVGSYTDLHTYLPSMIHLSYVCLHVNLFELLYLSIFLMFFLFLFF